MVVPYGTHTLRPCPLPFCPQLWCLRQDRGRQRPWMAPLPCPRWDPSLLCSLGLLSQSEIPAPFHVAAVWTATPWFQTRGQ